MNNVISLFNYNRLTCSEFPFVVFRTTNTDKVFSLSPDLMSVGNNIFISDLNFMHSYFESLSKIKKKPKNDIITNILMKIIEVDLAVLCHHPFQGLLLLKNFEDTHTKGIFEVDSLFVKNSYKNISFKSWVYCCKILNQLFEKERIFIKERKNFSMQINQFERLIKRIKVKSFGELRSVNFYEIQRRYKAFIGMTWRWTFPDTKKDKNLDFFSNCIYGNLEGFPWIDFKIKENPEVHNNLEFSVSTWDLVKPLLLFDFKKLTKFKSLLGESKVCQLKWKVVLYDMQTYDLEINFKHPISIQDENYKEFKILLKQFELSFNNFKEILKEKNKELQFININLIASWSIEVSKTINPCSETIDMFSITKRSSNEKIKIIDFDNKVDVNLNVNKTISSNIYGLDYLSESIGIEDRSFNTLDESKSIYPIFIYLKPIKFDESLIKLKRFLERSSTNWWELNDSMDSIRDYYICETEEFGLIWAFRNYKGIWFKHGLFS